MVPFLLAACSSSPVNGAAPFSADETIALEEDVGLLVVVEQPLGEEDEWMEFPSPSEDLPVSSFGEIWGYLLAGRERDLIAGMPISDIGYFGATINYYGKLVDIPNPRNISRFNGRVHLVVTSNGNALTHFVLLPGSKERRELIADLLAATRNFDGLQIDFENVPIQDGPAFLSFLAELRAGLKDKMFTIALPARTKTTSDNWYHYAAIKPLVDRILLMAYDEHWSGSKAGPIASMAWCKNVATYALQVIGREKLIMGLPFYGRAWGNTTTSTAYVYSSIERIRNENNVTEIRRENGIPTFDYQVPVSVKVYYEDDYSLAVRMDLYRTMGVNSVGFWRLGQETQAVWSLLKLKD
ncbi:glycoside hydrolase [Spirochaetia bacterium]|nr:glycoside hydrolase [Spirochaetia bacterium]